MTSAFARDNRGVMSDEHTALIVVGYDGSASATRALDRAAGIAGPGGQVIVVSVCRSAGDAEGGAPAPRADDPGALLEAARLYLAGRVAVDLREATGDVAEALASIAHEAGAGLIVVGAQGADFVARTLLGSVAQRLIQRAPGDVLIVR